MSGCSPPGAPRAYGEEAAIPKFQLDDVYTAVPKKCASVPAISLHAATFNKKCFILCKGPVSYKYFFIIELVTSLKM